MMNKYLDWGLIMWQKMHLSECPEWVEFHLNAVAPNGEGACLKVFFSAGYGGWRGLITTESCRMALDVDGRTEQAAKDGVLNAALEYGFFVEGLN